MSILFYILVTLIGVPVILAITIIYALSHYSEIKILISDILRFLGWVGKGVRKVSVTSELEGTLNGVINDFNKSFTDPMLPHCKIQWVTEGNHNNVLRANEAIICVSFDKKDHDLNFYNATYNFIKTALVAKAKPFLKAQTSNAIDLVSTKLILKEYRREVLRTFNVKFNEVEQETKQIFYDLEETENNGLFSTLLLPEFFYLGEILNDKTPSPLIQVETEQFVQWIHDLATREIDEYTNLRFERTYLKIGVILAAKLSTYEKVGVEAYTKWAEKYAAENFNAVYILAKGNYRSKIAIEIADVLIESKGFDQVNKKSTIKRTGPDGNPLVITSICLRPNLTTIVFNAWEEIKKKHDENLPVIGIIDSIIPGNIVVNVSGLKVNIPNNQLSQIAIPDLSKLFRADQELELNILEVDQANGLIRLSNVNTKTDPRKLIEANLSNDKPIVGKITKVQKDREQLEKGLIIHCVSPEVDVFIPRSKATFSRFTDLSKKYTVGNDVQILLQDFNSEFGNYAGSIFGLISPFETNTYKNLNIGDEIEVTIKEKQEKFLTCEIVEGLECRLYTNELSWIESECNVDNYNIGQKLKCKVYGIDRERKFIYISIKQISKSPKRIFFEKYENKIIEVTITKVDDNAGIFFITLAGNEKGFVHWSEIDWGNVFPLSKSFKTNDNIIVTPIGFSPSNNFVNYSMKGVFSQQYNEFKNFYNIGDTVEGKIVKCYPSICIVEFNLNTLNVRGYIHESRVSSCCFLNEGDIQKFLPLDSVFNFVIHEFNDKFQTIGLCRKTFLDKTRSVNLGDTYSVKFIITHGRKSFFYNNQLEGYILNIKAALVTGAEIEVLPINTTSNEFEVAN
jgi:ribosomal protein S1